MSTFLFIIITVAIASFTCAILIIASAVVSSRINARLIDQNLLAPNEGAPEHDPSGQPETEEATSHRGQPVRMMAR
ncbi:MAG: hypothetical protein R3C14_37545 [Caldilineaceae bacterium]